MADQDSLKDLLNNLDSSLNELVKLYRLLLDTVRREKTCLIEADINELEQVNLAKDKILVKIKTMEDRRIESAQALAERLTPGIQSPRLTDLAGKVGPVEGERLFKQRSVLNLLVARVKDGNTENRQLVEAALQSISGAMNNLRETLQDKPTYARKGKVEKGGASQGGQLVSREV